MADEYDLGEEDPSSRHLFDNALDGDASISSAEDQGVVESGSDNDVSSNDDEPEAEADREAGFDDEQDLGFVEPSYENANSLPFVSLCKRLDFLLKDKVTKHKKLSSRAEKLKFLLPPQLIQKISTPGEDERPQSMFPILRLLMPEIDTSRKKLNVKEKFLADMYGDALGLPKNSQEREKLINFSDPHFVSPSEGNGDFSQVLENILLRHLPYSGKHSRLTVGDINKALDELAEISSSRLTSNHDWQSHGNNKPALKKATRPSELRKAWLTNIIRDEVNGMSALEHKWFVRIMLQNLNCGLRYQQILPWYHPRCLAFYHSHNSLKSICDKICQPSIFNAPEEGDATAGDDFSNGLAPYLKHSISNIEIGKPFTPMFSQRTGFQRLLYDISFRHRAQADADNLSSRSGASSLAVQHPAYTIETKLDGERMIVHYHKDGKVQMHTRRGLWYSNLYSPSLGPAIRRAVGRHNFDLILDGEVVAWDNERQETVPYGNNRTIANLRRIYMEREGLIDERDANQHVNDEVVKTSRPSVGLRIDGNGSMEHELAGKECWLCFVVFDIIYFDGPGASSFLSGTVSSYIHPRPNPGPIVDLPLMERKKLLYRILDPQRNEVEFVQTMVIRPDAECMPGEQYFSFKNPPKIEGISIHLLDSISAIYSGAVAGNVMIDLKRRNGRSDEQISGERARKTNLHYKYIVETRLQEGLLFKDLATPYVLSDVSKTLAYWHKFKPDYFGGSAASDIDLVIIGAYFASGLRLAGKPSSFLCACVDSNDHELFLPLCKVNAGGVEHDVYNALLDLTGFEQSSDHLHHQTEFGRWFREEPHGKVLPDFVSPTSRQINQDGKGWRFVKRDYPDLWIRPEESLVVTINAGEIVQSDAFSAGLTLRFPRIQRVRLDGDAKLSSEIESEASLWRIWDSVGARSAHNTSYSFVGRDLDDSPCRFLTETQYKTSKRKKDSMRQKSTMTVGTGVMPDKLDSIVLRGSKFTVLEGKYDLDESSIDANEAKEFGFYEVAKSIKSKSDLNSFIKRHGGRVLITPDDTTLILGGRTDDPKVTIFSRNKRIIRWTFVVSVVVRWTSSNHGNDQPIMENDPSWLAPSVLDYLAYPGRPNGGLIAVGYLRSVSELLRAMNFLAESGLAKDIDSTSSMRPSKRHRSLSWQSLGKSNLAPEDRWVLSSKYQVFWHWESKIIESDKNPSFAVLYPDIFDPGPSAASLQGYAGCSTFILNDEIPSDLHHCRVASSIPLARAMGAHIVQELHENVSHLLCDLVPGIDEIVGLNADSSKCFKDQERFERLLANLRSQRWAASRLDSIHVISPAWLRKRAEPSLARQAAGR